MLAFPDIVVLVLYCAIIVAVGAWFGRRKANMQDYFLGGRRIP